MEKMEGWEGKRERKKNYYMKPHMKKKRSFFSTDVDMDSFAFSTLAV